MAMQTKFVGAAHPLHADGLTAAAEHAGVDPAVLWSVVLVETSGCGFLPDRRPGSLFERHIFSQRTARRFDTAHPGISGSAGGILVSRNRFQQRLSLKSSGSRKYESIFSHLHRTARFSVM